MTTQEQIEILEKTIEWLDNLDRLIDFSSLDMVNPMPNNFGGRYAIRDVIEDLKEEAPSAPMEALS